MLSAQLFLFSGANGLFKFEGFGATVFSLIWFLFCLCSAQVWPKSCTVIIWQKILRKLDLWSLTRHWPALHLSIDAFTGTPRATDWKRPPSCTRRTWLQQVEEDVGLPIYDCQFATLDRSLWRSLQPSAGQAQQWVSVVDQPRIVVAYNHCMGRLYQNVSTYHIFIRMKKWRRPMFSFLLSISVNNA